MLTALTCNKDVESVGPPTLGGGFPWASHPTPPLVHQEEGGVGQALEAVALAHSPHGSHPEALASTQGHALWGRAWQGRGDLEGCQRSQGLAGPQQLW